MNYGIDYQGDAGDSGGGGGFNSGMGGGSQSPGQTKSRRSYDEQTIVPITVRMALASHPDPSGNGQTLEDGRKVSLVKIVGAVRSADAQSTHVLYLIEDGTGLIDVKQWVDDNDCTAIQQLRDMTAKDNIYVKIVGKLNIYEGKTNIMANSVRPLSSGNELAHHMIHVVYSAESNKRADCIVPPVQSSGVGFGGPTGAPISNNNGAAGAGSGDQLRDRVIEYLKTEGEHSEVGANVKQCIQTLGPSQESEIKRIVDELASEGHIYSTINDDHWKFAA